MLLIHLGQLNKANPTLAKDQQQANTQPPHHALTAIICSCTDGQFIAHSWTLHQAKGDVITCPSQQATQPMRCCRLFSEDPLWCQICRDVCPLERNEVTRLIKRATYIPGQVNAVHGWGGGHQHSYSAIGCSWRSKINKRVITFGISSNTKDSAIIARVQTIAIQ